MKPPSSHTYRGLLTAMFEWKSWHFPPSLNYFSALIRAKMRRFITNAASSHAHFTWGRSCVYLLIILLILNFTNSVNAKNSGPNIPDGPCQNQIDCVDIGWTSPLPNCEDSVCQCRPGTCPVYTTTYPSYSFFCGSCGMLGSECTNDTDCMLDWQCENSFCECDKGTAYQGVCLHYWSPSSSYISSIILTLLLLVVFIAIIIKLFLNAYKNRGILYCCSSTSNNEDESSVVASNPHSNDKTAAFTITNSDFMATVEDPDERDLALALERSRREYYELNATTLSTTRSSLPPADPRFTNHEPPAQPSTSGWRQPSSDVGTQRRSSRASQSSTSSSLYCSCSSGTVSSCSSTPPSASPYSPLASPSHPPGSPIFSDEVSLPSLESQRMEVEDTEFETTRM